MNVEQAEISTEGISDMILMRGGGQKFKPKDIYPIYSQVIFGIKSF